MNPLEVEKKIVFECVICSTHSFDMDKTKNKARFDISWWIGHARIHLCLIVMLFESE